MPLTDVLILALVQGLTEFLPVSSSGHLVIARLLFNIPDIEGAVFDTYLHLGTLAAVLLYYWRVWWGIARGLWVRDEEGRDKRELLLKLIVATLPAAIAGYLLQEPMSHLFRSPAALAWSLLITAALLLVSDYLSAQKKTVDRATFLDAFLIGLAQIIALVPAISRSGATIAAARARGLSRRQAVTFSFLMSAPIIAGAGVNSFSQLLTNHAFAPQELLLGFVISLVSGYLAIAWLMKYIQRVSFWPFVVYLVIISGILFYVGK